MGDALYDNPQLLGRDKIVGAHYIEVGADEALNREVDQVFLQLVEEGGKAYCSHCHAHTVRPENRLVPVRPSRSCERSLEISDPRLYQFLKTATPDEMRAAVTSDYLTLQFT